MSGPGGTLQQQKPDYSASHSFPATCELVLEFGAGDVKFMLILGTGDPSTDYSKAPLGALYINRTQGSCHVKTANPNTWSDTGP